jgi:hypothetical protein
MRAALLVLVSSALGVCGGGCSASDPGVGDPGVVRHGGTGNGAPSSSGSGSGGSSGGSSSGSGGGGSGGGSGGSSGAGSSSGGSGSGAIDDAGGGSSSSGGGGADAGGPGAFGAACQQNADCASNDCQLFQGKGGYYCTQPCQTAADCPNPPNLGCNNMGQCKVP